MTAVLGIDPGAHGAIAVLDEGGELLHVLDMPSLPEANGRSATNAPLLGRILARTHARIAFCEFVGARPTDAKVAAFAFGRARGVIEGCAGALGRADPVDIVTAIKIFNLGQRKFHWGIFFSSARDSCRFGQSFCVRTAKPAISAANIV